MRIDYLKEVNYLRSLLQWHWNKQDQEPGDYLNVQFFDETAGIDP